MHRPSFDKGYLHPYYEPTWNNPLNKPVSQATVFPRNVAARRLKFPDVPGQPSSPGLTEVLSSYTPGPTVIMIEKKRSKFYKSKAMRVICAIIILLSLGFLLWSKLWSFQNSLHGGTGLVNDTIAARIIPSFETVMGSCDKNDCSSFSRYSSESSADYPPINIIYSVDDDDESFVEDIFPYTIISN